MASILKQIADLDNLSHDELVGLWRNLNGNDPPSYNRQFIMKRLAYQLQGIAYGGLSEEAHRKMDAVLKRHGYDENAMPARASRSQPVRMKDLPIPGSRFVRGWNGRRYEVIVLQDGFEFEGRKFRSLSAVAKAITGTHWNGRVFFGIAGRNVD